MKTKKILDWLTSMDYGPLQSGHFNTCQIGTGQWLFGLKQFQDWVTSGGHTVFCHGIPGSGKTILTSLIISHLYARFRGAPEIGMAYIYFDYKRVEEQKFEKLLASLLKQLAGGRPHLSESTKELYRQHSTRRTRLLLSELMTDFECVISQHSKLFIILDALDECQSFDLVRFLSLLSDLQKDHAINILATSRPIPQIMDLFNNINNTILEIRSEMSDIMKYIDGQMGLLPNVVQGNLSLIQEIKAVISEAADGMFLLAKIYLTLLQDKMTVNEICEQLGVYKLQNQGKQDNHKGEILREAYEQAIERIKSQKKGLRTLAMRVLTWVTFVKREITILELQHALATEAGSSTLNHDCLPDLKDISYVCLGLVTVDEQSRIIRLAHYTTQLYLEQTQNHWSPSANATILRGCVTYLSLNAFGSGVCQSDEEFGDRTTSFPLYDYAANHWKDHISHDEEPSKEVMLFLESQTRVEASSQALFALKWHTYHTRSSQVGPIIVTGLHLAAGFGMVKATKLLLERGYGPDSKTSYASTPLMWASYHGHEAVARLLIDAGAALEAKDLRHRYTPLMWAIKRGHDTVVKLFLDRGSNVNSRDPNGLTPLSLAMHCGHQTIIELLLRSGGTIEDGNTATKLSLITFDAPIEDILNSISKSDVNIQQLREYVDDLNAEGSNLRPLLSLVAEDGRRRFIKLLIWTRMANMNKEDLIAGMTALHWAAKKGDLSIVELLINAGADLNAKETQRQYTPLVLAILEYRNDVVDLLLRRGADANTVDTYGQTPLFVAAGMNSWAVQQLLDNGADINAVNYRGMTPLFIAASYENFDSLRLLVERGADVNIRGAGEIPPLCAAAAFGRTDVVKLLVERGAYVNAKSQSSDGMTPLMIAALLGKTGIVKLLVERGADVNARDNNGFTPLLCAARGGQPAIIQTLIDHSAEINRRNSAGDSALSIAVRCGHETIVKLMTEMDEVNLNTQNAKGMSPISLAIRQENKNIMHILFRTGKITSPEYHLF